MGAVRFVQLNFVAGVVDVCALPPGARADSLHGPFNCLATKISFAEILVASVFPPWLVRSVSVPVLSVSLVDVARWKRDGKISVSN